MKQVTGALLIIAASILVIPMFQFNNPPPVGIIPICLLLGIAGILLLIIGLIMNS